MTHPAIPLITAGRVTEAIAYLEARGDHPSGLAVLKAGFEPEAAAVLAGVAPTPSLTRDYCDPDAVAGQRATRRGLGDRRALAALIEDAE